MRSAVVLPQGGRDCGKGQWGRHSEWPLGASTETGYIWGFRGMDDGVLAGALPIETSLSGSSQSK
jgi:hypothetical protein